MCGIAGIISLSQDLTADNKILKDILAYQHHRGPDACHMTQIFKPSFQVLLGHNRLRIVDLSSQADQPWWDAHKNYCIVYNGEIYNYRELRAELQRLGYVFTTQSDTEVIVKAYEAWGVDAFNRFNGPFAFALYDARQEVMILCRDRFGVKPFYYFKDRYHLYFASSMKPIADATHLKIHTDYLYFGIKNLYYETDSLETPYQNLWSLKPGSFAKIVLKNTKMIDFSLQSYYQLPLASQHAENPSAESFLSLKEKLTSLLESAVSLRLRADVPVAVSLSGGLDSSSVAYWVRKNQPASSLMAFTFGTLADRHSEAKLVKELSERIALPVQYVTIHPHQFKEAILSTLAAQESPFANPSIIAQNLLYQTVQSFKIRVLLGGQGGDEALMGYRKYLWAYVKKLMKEKKFKMISSEGIFLLLTSLAEYSNWGTYWQHRHRYFRDTALKTVLSWDGFDIPSQNPVEVVPRSTQDALWDLQYQDIVRKSLPTLLRYEDKNAMYYGVESRLPFLDYRMIEFGLTLPVFTKIKKGYGKWILRESMKEYLPKRIRLARYKRGFDINFKNWLSQGFGQALRELLLEYSNVPYFNAVSRDIPVLFSDQNLLTHPSAFREAMTWLWLGVNHA